MGWGRDNRSSLVAGLGALSLLAACCLQSTDIPATNTGTGSTTGLGTGGCERRGATGGTSVTPCSGTPTYGDAGGAIPHEDVGFVVNRVLVGDFNNDCLLDLAISDQGNGTATPPGGIDLLLGNGDGTFGRPKVVQGVPDIAALATGDFNGDGIPDLAGVVFEACGDDLKVLLGNGDGTFTNKSSYKAGFSCVYAWDLATGDFNGDGTTDIAVATLNGLRVLLGNGDGTFRLLDSMAGTWSLLVVAADFNADGKLDLALALASTRPAVVFGNGDGTFSAPVMLSQTDLAIDWSFSALAAADLNGDGFPDVVAATTGPGGLSVFLNDGRGGFLPGAFYAAGEPSSVTIGDVNADGRPDLVVGQYSGRDPAVEVFLGNGDGSFGAPIGYSSGSEQAFSISVGDFRGDGHMDLVAGGVGIDVFLYSGCQ